jgi:hypothetical protein
MIVPRGTLALLTVRTMVRLLNTRSSHLRLAAVGILVVACSLSASAQKSNSIKLMRGIITDVKSGKPIDGGRLFVYSGTSTEPVALSRINPGTGAYQVVLGPAMEYRFVITSPRFLAAEHIVRTPDRSGYEELTHNLTVKPIPVGQTLFSGRAFDGKSSVVRSSSELTKAIEFMKTSQAATLTITVAGDGASAGASKAAKGKAKKGKKGAAPVTTTETTTPASTATLSQARVQALKSLLQKEGISLTRMTWKSVDKAKDNLVITITGVDVEEVEEE